MVEDVVGLDFDHSPLEFAQFVFPAPRAWMGEVIVTMKWANPASSDVRWIDCELVEQ